MPVPPRPELSKEIGALIRHHREVAGLSQSQLAERVDLSVEFIGRIERGQAAPTVATLATLADAFHLPLRDLFGVAEFTVGSTGHPALSRIFTRLAVLEPADLEWIDRLLATVLDRRSGGRKA